MMRFPWSNLVLLLLLVLQFVSGYFGLVNGMGQRAWVLWIHSLGGFGIVFILIWKAAVILSVYRRRLDWNLSRLTFLLLLLLLLGVLASGLIWTFRGPTYIQGFSLVTIHILLAVVLLLILIWHTWYMRFILRHPGAWGRRLFLGTVGGLSAGLAVWQAASRLKQLLDLPAVQRRFTGSYETGSFSTQFPPTVWIADSPSPIDVDDWRLQILGRGQEPLVLDYIQLVFLAQTRRTAILDCTGGWFTNQLWEGADLETLLQLAGIPDGIRSVEIESITGYGRRFSLQDSRAFLLATAVAGRPLKHAHGFPARLVAPGWRGFQWVKWVHRIALSELPPSWQSPLPLQ